MSFIEPESPLALHCWHLACTAVKTSFITSFCVSVVSSRQPGAGYRVCTALEADLGALRAAGTRGVITL